MRGCAVIGSGLAGLLFAEAWTRTGRGQLCLIDGEDPLRASGAPLAICHPFPGRSLRPHPLLQRAYAATQEIVADWQSWAPDLVRTLPMVRPLAGANHERLQTSYAREWANHPAPWVRVALHQEPPRLEYGPCYAVALGPLRLRWIERLREAGVEIIKDRLIGLEPKTNSLQLTGQTLQAKQVVLGLGQEMKRWFPASGLINEGGELGVYGVHRPLEQLISQAGVHLAPLGDNQVVGGSTRWERCPETPPEAVLPTLAARLEPLAAQLLEPLAAWRGVRSIAPSDRLPIAGRLPGLPHLAVLGALGSKGLLWGPLAAKALVDELSGGEELPEALSIHRFPAAWWRLEQP
jgi:glycine/D-amino acid oxidase-like deaminating enzyme